MSYEITVTVTAAQHSALQYVAETPQMWCENLVNVRANLGVEEIVALYIAKALEEGVAIPATKELIVADAFERKWVQTMEEINNQPVISELP